ncbi:hypothetical protein [Flavobacterium lindanitolerans]|jgi:hypothetical protein|uniref:hypothetical protein n=1 Tax=Flavobacterium lindanitolerans TaxID=428988 RepID=UPI0023F52A2B|nr:hypothetical protein [Flavobacterium lindanitolerans]
MKKGVLLLFAAVVTIACNQNVSKEDAKKLNGYWEIEKVILADGSEKDYKINTTYDFFEIGNNYKGFRKKVSPQLDGKFLTDDTSEAVEIVEKNGKVYLDYKTDYAKWEEELKSVSENHMTIVNPQKIEYQYKRATPINLLDGKEAK